MYVIHKQVSRNRSKVTEYRMWLNTTRYPKLTEIANEIYCKSTGIKLKCFEIVSNVTYNQSEVIVNRSSVILNFPNMTEILNEMTCKSTQKWPEINQSDSIYIISNLTEVLNEIYTVNLYRNKINVFRKCM